MYFRRKMDRQAESQGEQDPASAWGFDRFATWHVRQNRLNNREHDLEKQVEVLCMAKSI